MTNSSFAVPLAEVEVRQKLLKEERGKGRSR